MKVLSHCRCAVTALSLSSQLCFNADSFLLKHGFRFMNPTVITLLQQGQRAHQEGRLAAAEQAYTQVLQIDAQQFDAIHLLGVIAQQRGDYDTAMNFYGKALKRDQRHAGLFANLGACLLQLQQPTEALEALEQAISLDPRSVLAYIIRGKVLRSLKRYQLAIQSFETAMELQIDAIDAYYERGLCLQELALHEDALLDFEDGLHFAKRTNLTLGRFHFARGFSLQAMHQWDDAIQSYHAAIDDPATQLKALFNLSLLEASQGHLEQALIWVERAHLVDSQFIRGHLHHGHLLRQMDRFDEAASAYQEAAACGLPFDQLEFLLASLGRHESPHMAPIEYVRELFDQYADHFDHHLSHQLDYQLPALLGRLFKQYLRQSCSHILDLGCGTGLCGAQLRNYTQNLVGVDVSANMLEKAAHREVYDQLHCADILAFLAAQTEQQNSFDAILLADVLVYFGELRQVLAACQHQLRSGALLFFTVELDQPSTTASLGYRLQGNQRYAHQEHYLPDIAIQQQWEVIEMHPHALRREGKEMLTSLVCVWRKA